jgi:hypothetical protein
MICRYPERDRDSGYQVPFASRETPMLMAGAPA